MRRGEGPGTHLREAAPNPRLDKLDKQQPPAFLGRFRHLSVVLKGRATGEIVRGQGLATRVRPACVK